MVFYLLSNSTERWLPLTWMDLISKTIAGRNISEDEEVNAENSAHITTAVEEAIRSVFVLSAKMSVFYGLYTYFVHSLFDLNVIFVPSSKWFRNHYDKNQEF